MIRQLTKFFDKIKSDGSTRQDRAALLVRDDQLLQAGPEDLCTAGQDLLGRLNAVALVITEPLVPFHDVCLSRLAPGLQQIVPLDTETRTFLHDIPLLRKYDGRIDMAAVAEQLGRRKGVLVEGLGIIAAGTATVEQAYINFSTVYHALFIRYLQQLLQDPPRRDEMAKLRPLLNRLCRPIAECAKDLPGGPFLDRDAARKAIEEAGRRTVELHLVDSFFGNVSCHINQQIMISQTGASLAELACCIDTVADDNSSTAGLTASSELPAHRAIYAATDAAVILHGHPKFTVVMSLLCDEQDCDVVDCWKECPHIRFLGKVPVVAGEVGAGGIAKTLPPVMAQGIAVVYGHGAFAVGRRDLRQPLRALIALENWCRSEYLRRLDQIS